MISIIVSLTSNEKGDSFLADYGVGNLHFGLLYDGPHKEHSLKSHQPQTLQPQKPQPQKFSLKRQVLRDASRNQTRDANTSKMSRRSKT